MLVEGFGAAALRDYERDVQRRLSFANVREAMKVLADLDAYERGSDALGYEAIQWNARVRRAASDFLRDHPIEAGCARCDDLQAGVAYWRETAAAAPSDAERRDALDAAAETADELSAQLAALAQLTVRAA